MANPRTTLTPEALAPILAALDDAEEAFVAGTPGPTGSRRPVHVLYGGADRFTAETAAKMGALALKAFDARLPDAAALARVTGMPATLAAAVRPRVAEKLAREAVEDFRIDFEDGYGPRPDAEEDAHAVGTALETATGLARSSLPPFLGIRVKPLDRAQMARSSRTLDLYLTALLRETRGRLPAGFVVTLPKVAFPEQVLALSDLLERIERAHVLRSGSVAVELLIETPTALVSTDGAVSPRLLVEAARGRCVGLHLGPYDMTASMGVDVGGQTLDHPACAFALRLAAAAVSGTGVELSDGPVATLPLGDDVAAVDGALALHYRQVRRALTDGIHRGWDLHPAQLGTRYAAVYAHYLEALPAARERLTRFTDGRAQAVAAGTVFDDAATVRGLTNFFKQGLACGALKQEDAPALSLTP